VVAEQKADHGERDVGQHWEPALGEGRQPVEHRRPDQKSRDEQQCDPRQWRVPPGQIGQQACEEQPAEGDQHLRNVRLIGHGKP
jgi:hypothetical protein